ncbi:MAG: hypothetical protein KGJ23_12955 [Euryarchaeota archaeon]|nr:hypothetical protein [Euryarchaeota archaeon]MDE1837508.1 hypothetical protein [Euryarchaeota archaeon]MDE1882246.1 hypothetical protein [Euryarchaeota archaeon]MDE2045526.1 hypothetical protein [Thermoplasmata archaeon]
MGWEPANRSVFVGNIWEKNISFNSETFSMTWHISGRLSFFWGDFGDPCYAFTNCTELWGTALSDQSNRTGWGSSSISRTTLSGPWANASFLRAWNYWNATSSITFEAWWNGTGPEGFFSGSLLVPPTGRVSAWMEDCISVPSGGMSCYVTSPPDAQMVQAPESTKLNTTTRWFVELTGSPNGSICVGWIGNFSYAPSIWTGGPTSSISPNGTSHEVFVPGPGTWVSITGPPFLTPSSHWFPTTVLRCNAPFSSYITVKSWTEVLPA